MYVAAPGRQLRWCERICPSLCRFVLNSGGAWSSAYRCFEEGTMSCSADGRTIARCNVVTSLIAPSVYACGLVVNGTPACSATLLNDDCNGFGRCELPTMYQYFPTDAAAM